MDASTIPSPLSHLDAATMLDTLAVPVLVLDRDCCVVFINGSACALLGLQLRQLRGQPLDLLFADGQRVRGMLSRLVSGGPEQASRPLRIEVCELARADRRLALKAQIIDDELTGPHLLVQLARNRVRSQRPRLHLLQRAEPVLDSPPVALVAGGGTQLECA
jgi:nitrogen-specific signal transduction histidine kinase